MDWGLTTAPITHHLLIFELEARFLLRVILVKMRLLKLVTGAGMALRVRWDSLKFLSASTVLASFADNLLDLRVDHPIHDALQVLDVVVIELACLGFVGVLLGLLFVILDALSEVWLLKIQTNLTLLVFLRAAPHIALLHHVVLDG